MFLKMKQVEARIALKLQNFQQKQHRLTIAEEKRTFVADYPDLLKRVITGEHVGIWLRHWK